MKKTLNAHEVHLWSNVLLEQHEQMRAEIQSLEELLKKSSPSTLIVDVKVKKLIRALIMHLDLEANFLYPELLKSQYYSKDCKTLMDGYQCLKNTCHDAKAFIQQLKIKNGNRPIKVSQIKVILNFIHKIKTRLETEDVIYSIN